MENKECINCKKFYTDTQFNFCPACGKELKLHSKSYLSELPDKFKSTDGVWRVSVEETFDSIHTILGIFRGNIDDIAFSINTEKVLMFEKINIADESEFKLPTLTRDIRLIGNSSPLKYFNNLTYSDLLKTTQEFLKDRGITVEKSMHDKAFKITKEQ